MDCKTTSHDNRKQAGFTIVEFLVSLLLSLLTIGAILAMWLNSSKSTSSLACYIELDSNARRALESLSTDLRQATNIVSFATNSISLQLPTDGNVTYSWDRNSKLFQCSKTNKVTTLLTGCDSLSFSMHKASPIDGVMDLESTPRLKECKGVKVTWKCSRTAFGARSNTENITSATMVLRMQN